MPIVPSGEKYMLFDSLASSWRSFVELRRIFLLQRLLFTEEAAEARKRAMESEREMESEWVVEKSKK